MFKNPKAKDYAKHKQTADASFKKAKTTGSSRAMKKAKTNYAYCDYLELQAKNPATKVNVKQTTIKDSFKSSKDTTYGVSNPKTTFNSKKKVIKNTKKK